MAEQLLIREKRTKKSHLVEVVYTRDGETYLDAENVDLIDVPAAIKNFTNNVIGDILNINVLSIGGKE